MKLQPVTLLWVASIALEAQDKDCGSGPTCVKLYNDEQLFTSYEADCTNICYQYSSFSKVEVDPDVTCSLYSDLNCKNFIRDVINGQIGETHGTGQFMTCLLDVCLVEVGVGK